MPNNRTDEDLMVAYQLGDEAAFRELYERHSPRIFGFLRSKLRDERTVEDVFQATFLKLHRSRGQYDSSLPVVPWLFTICRNELVDTLRRTRRSLEDLTNHPPEPASSAPAISRDLNLAELSPVQRQALELRFQQEASFEEIAKALGTSSTNARQVISRAVRNLRSHYGKK